MEQSQPNILFIMADDHASKAISAYGYGINHTPNMDRLAKEGMLFNHCYVTNSICTPSRAAILTGTYNHVNGVLTLEGKLNKHLPNVAKHLWHAGYDTAMVGKWHLGEGKDHEPTGFDYWSIVPGQGDYFDPRFIEPNGTRREAGYVTNVITSKCLTWLRDRHSNDVRPPRANANPKRPFFLMCHHKAPHRSWECHPKHRDLFKDHDIRIPETFDDDYKNRARAAAEAKMRVDTDFTYFDLGLAQPDGGAEEVGEFDWEGSKHRKVPLPKDVTKLRLVDAQTGETFTFKTSQELREFKYQRYMKRYLRTIASIDDSVGELLDYLDAENLAKNTIVIYTSDQGFFLGDHGWFDKRFMYEESFQMPFLIRYPAEIKSESVCNDLVCNVDFPALWLDYAGVRIPSYMQGRSFRPLLQGKTPVDWLQIAYHRYWMHRDRNHNAYAHYGIRNSRYKLIFWYNKGYDLPGTLTTGGEEELQEWELFDCEKDPLELINVYNHQAYQDIVKTLTRELDAKMAEIGDEPEHEFSN